MSNVLQCIVPLRKQRFFLKKSGFFSFMHVTFKISVIDIFLDDQNVKATIFRSEDEHPKYLCAMPVI